MEKGQLDDLKRLSVPDPLLFTDGQPVTTSVQWQRRRSEILQLFEKHVYGTFPQSRVQVTADVQRVKEGAVDGKGVQQQVRLHLGGEKSTGWYLDLLLILPGGHSGKRGWPVFLAMNLIGNHTVSADPEIPLHNHWLPDYWYGIKNNRVTEASRGRGVCCWPLARILERGYALATFCCMDLIADYEPDFLQQRPRLFDGKKRGLHESGALGAWAWGLGRVMDYLEAVDEIDHRRVALLGHSRMGKSALWAAANDTRYSIIIANASGCGGASLARLRQGETIAEINGRFPHWFCLKYRDYGGHEELLPLDQHMLLALAAPRPVYIASAAADQWAGPLGEFAAALLADPVYRLLSGEGLDTDTLPPLNTPVPGRIGYHIREGEHGLTDFDWEQFLDFADRYLPDCMSGN